MEVTQRDITILRLIYIYRALTTRQITALEFGKDERSTQAEERLKRLYHNGYLDRRSQGVTYEDNKPLVYMLTEKGAQLLCEVDGMKREEIFWKPKYNQISNYHLQHVIAVSDVRIAFERACQRLDYELNWLTEMSIRHHGLYDTFRYHTPNGWTKTTSLIPDGFCTLDTPEMWLACFIEVDRGTETLRTVADKYAKYIAYLGTEAYANRYAAFNEEGHEIYPSILTITTSQERLGNLMQVALDVGADELFLFSTFSQITHERILEERVWRRGDVHTLIKLVA